MHTSQQLDLEDATYFSLLVILRNLFRNRGVFRSESLLLRAAWCVLASSPSSKPADPCVAARYDCALKPPEMPLSLNNLFCQGSSHFLSRSLTPKAEICMCICQSAASSARLLLEVFNKPGALERRQC